MLHEDFVSIGDVYSEAKLEIRYATAHNLTGAPLDGYHAEKALLVKPAAEALGNAMQQLKKQGYGILIYDAYRPQKAVDCFLRWSKQPEDYKTKDEFYPELEKSQLFPLGYIALKSGHSRGATVDLTLTDGKGEPVAMGTEFDFMSNLSHHGAAGVTEEQAANRLVLKNAMEAAGFLPYENEWWHYRLADEPYPNTYFDFDID